MADVTPEPAIDPPDTPWCDDCDSGSCHHLDADADEPRTPDFDGWAADRQADREAEFIMRERGL